MATGGYEEAAGQNSDEVGMGAGGWGNRAARHCMPVALPKNRDGSSDSPVNMIIFGGV